MRKVVYITILYNVFSKHLLKCKKKGCNKSLRYPTNGIKWRCFELIKLLKQKGRAQHNDETK